MKSEQHIPDCDSWLVRPPAWLCSVSTRNIWKFCLSVLRFPSFISDWLICFPHSESTNIEQQEITINGCLGPSAVHCSIWMHMRATPLTNTEFLHINTLCSHTHTLPSDPLLPPKAVSVLASPPHGLRCFCGHLTIELKIIYRAKKLQNIQQNLQIGKRNDGNIQRKELCDAGKCPLTSVFEEEKEKNALLVSAEEFFFLQLWSLKKEMVNDGKRCPWTDSCQADFVVIVCHREMKSYSPNPSSRCGLWSRSVQFLFNQSQILLLQCQLLQSLKKMTADSPWSPWVAAAAVRAVMHLWKCKRMSAKD